MNVNLRNIRHGLGWIHEDREDVVYIVDEDEDGGGVSNEVQAAAKGRDRYRQGNAR